MSQWRSSLRTLTNLDGFGRRLLRLPARLYDWHARCLLGHRFLRLTHVGRRSGRLHQTVLEVIRTSPRAGEFVVMSGFGRPADWYRNLAAAPAVEVAAGNRRFRPAHRVLGEAEAVEVRADYERRNRRVAIVVRRVLTWLVCWNHDGSDEARRRLLQELPVVAFRPVVAS